MAPLPPTPPPPSPPLGISIQKVAPGVEAGSATGLSAEEEKEVRKRGVDYVPF